MGATAVKVHRRRPATAPAASPTGRVAAKLASLFGTGNGRAGSSRAAASSDAPEPAASGSAPASASPSPIAKPVARSRSAKSATPSAAKPVAAADTLTPRTAAVGAPIAAVFAPPSPARADARALTRRMRPATSRPVAAVAGTFQADPVLAGRARRGAYPAAAPSLGAFYRYLTDHSDLRELRSVGLSAMMRAHRGMQLALIAVVAFLVLTVAVLGAWFWLTPATADADSPYATAEVGAPTSTPPAQWRAGSVPSLYQGDAAWADVPYGQDTLKHAGAAPCALAMAYVAVTGDTARTPVDFAQWATDRDLAATGSDTIAAFLTGAADDFGLELVPIAAEDRSLRHAIVSHVPVLVITQPGTFSPVASVVVLDDIDRDSHIVLHDPTSPTRTGKGWQFSDITGAAAQVYEVHAA